MSRALALALLLATGCAQLQRAGQALTTCAAQLATEAGKDVAGDVALILEAASGNWLALLQALEVRGAELVACAVQRYLDATTTKLTASPAKARGLSRARIYLERRGTR